MYALKVVWFAFRPNGYKMERAGRNCGPPVFLGKV